jgi:hypothetical protein
MEEYTCVPVDITRATAQELDFWMSRFIMECRRVFFRKKIKARNISIHLSNYNL